jgi:hypothetical protein
LRDRATQPFGRASEFADTVEPFATEDPMNPRNDPRQRPTSLAWLLSAGVAAPLLALPVLASAQCVIQGPEAVTSDETFTLCGPRGYEYEWFGPGVPAGTDTRCITIPGRRVGQYQYVLVLRGSGGEVDRCTQVVNVGGGATGSLQCEIGGPGIIETGNTAELCAPASSVHNYEWTGPAGFSSTARCVQVRTQGTYRLIIRNRLTGYTRECTHWLEVTGSGAAGDLRCDIDGPNTVAAGSRISLCGPVQQGLTYRWRGPGGYIGSTSCVIVGAAGIYTLTMRNPLTGDVDECSHRVYAATTGGGTTGCDISGPVSIDLGGRAVLCGPSRSGATYRWSGPGNFTASTRCVSVDDLGTYVLTVRAGGVSERCTHVLRGVDDADNPAWDNCPRSVSYWQLAVRRQGQAARDISRADLRRLARAIDARSGVFNWSNDLQGLRAALHPTGSATSQKWLVREYAALLANLDAGRLRVTAANGSRIGLDPDTRIAAWGSRSVAQLERSVENMLTTRRGNLVATARIVAEVNAGRGIGPVCD